MVIGYRLEACSWRLDCIWQGEMNKVNLCIAQKKIAEFCKANRIRRLALFGSVLREDFSPSIIAVESPVKVEQQEHKGAF
jgi:hypothetical protein